jgi:hypothetical protein
VSNAPVLSGIILAELNRTNAQTADKLVVSSGTLSYGGTLTVNNIGDVLQSGDVFDLFDAASFSGGFSTFNLPGGAIHWNTANLTLDGSIAFTNNAPTATNASVARAAGLSAKVLKSTLAGDIDGDSVSFTLVATTNGATLTQDANYIYIPTNNVNDEFTFTVNDAFGGTNSATVTVSIATAYGSASGNVSLTSSNATAVLSGIPGYNYSAQRATDAGFTAGISNFPSVTAGANGQITVVDDFADLGSVPGAAFYRLQYNP